LNHLPKLSRAQHILQKVRTLRGHSTGLVQCIGAAVCLICYSSRQVRRAQLGTRGRQETAGPRLPRKRLCPESCPAVAVAPMITFSRIISLSSTLDISDMSEWERRYPFDRTCVILCNQDSVPLFVYPWHLKISFFLFFGGAS
jgi:hypothetical protein